MLAGLEIGFKKRTGTGIIDKPFSHRHLDPIGLRALHPRRDRLIVAAQQAHRAGAEIGAPALLHQPGDFRGKFFGQITHNRIE